MDFVGPSCTYVTRQAIREQKERVRQQKIEAILLKLWGNALLQNVAREGRKFTSVWACKCYSSLVRQRDSAGELEKEILVLFSGGRHL